MCGLWGSARLLVGTMVLAQVFHVPLYGAEGAVDLPSDFVLAGFRNDANRDRDLFFDTYNVHMCT